MSSVPLDLEMIPLASLALSRDGRVVRANDLALRYFKVKAGEIQGKSIFEWIESSDADFFYCMLRADTAGSLKVTTRFREEKRSSALLWIRGNSEGEAIVTISPGVAHSAVSPSYKTLEGLTDRVRLYQQILDGIPDMVLVKQAQSRIFWANRAFREVYGMSNEQLRDMLDAPFVEPSLTANYTKDDAQVFGTGQPLVIPQEVVIRHDGVRRTFRTVKLPVFDESGVVVLTVGISRDITDALREQGQLQEQEERIVALTKTSLLGQLGMQFAGELDSTLSAITTRTAQLREMAADGKTDPTVVAGLAERIDSVVQGITKTLQAFRAFSRDGSDDIFEWTAVETIVESTVKLVAEKARTLGIDIQVDLDPKDLAIECQPMRLAQILLCLFYNSIDAVRDRREKWIHLTALGAGTEVKITIADSGAGIAQIDAEQIFEPFFSKTRSGDHSGLGLTVARRIAEAHGGSLVYSPVQGHTAFTLTIPFTHTLRKTG